MTEPAHQRTTRASYDIAATAYADLLRTALDDQPYDRAMLALFAELVRTTDAGPVADLGCGPGRVTGHLSALGLPAFGIDLSPGMIAEARKAYPELRFTVGSMRELDLPDAGLGGVVAWYSVIHTPPEQLPVLFAEFHRVLAPGSHLLLAFKAGDERVHLDQAYGHDLSLDVYWLPPDRVAELLREAGLVVDARLVREPIGYEKSPQAYLLGHKPL
ncbi:class I SAM-dependent methyltransferase [Streptomyces sp. NPDC051320]|uniref:class I SAM-dependent DNA methyltransferase n=1 Tax=Streptomyces sp. NPDC051320 TaxID=3154644 RepID=UPI00342701F2